MGSSIDLWIRDRDLLGTDLCIYYVEKGTLQVGKMCPEDESTKEIEEDEEVTSTLCRGRRLPHSDLGKFS